MRMRGWGRLVPGLLVAGLAALAGPECFAANTIHLFATGATQGTIEGDSPITSLGRENSIVVYEVHHLITREGTTRKHEPLVFMKRVDKSSPQLYRALDTAESLALEFRYYRPDPSGAGAEQQYYTLRLTNAQVAAIEPVTRNVLEQANSSLPDMERVRETYQQITITYVDGGIEAILTNTGPR